MNTAKAGDGDFLRSVAESVLQMLMEAAVTRLVGAILLEQNDEWAVQRRCMSLKTLAPSSDAPNVSLPAVAN
jgi:hypothetical protein